MVVVGDGRTDAAIDRVEARLLNIAGQGNLIHEHIIDQINARQEKIQPLSVPHIDPLVQA